MAATANKARGESASRARATGLHNSNASKNKALGSQKAISNPGSLGLKEVMVDRDHRGIAGHRENRAHKVNAGRRVNQGHHASRGHKVNRENNAQETNNAHKENRGRKLRVVPSARPGHHAPNRAQGHKTNKMAVETHLPKVDNRTATGITATTGVVTTAGPTVATTRAARAHHLLRSRLLQAYNNKPLNLFTAGATPAVFF